MNDVGKLLKAVELQVTRIVPLLFDQNGPLVSCVDIGDIVAHAGACRSLNAGRPQARRSQAGRPQGIAPTLLDRLAVMTYIVGAIPCGRPGGLLVPTP